MRTRQNRNRCRVCRQVPNAIVVRIVQFSYMHGWHMTMPLCQPCARALFVIVEQVRSEYQ